MQKEAVARIKINRLLEKSGWRFFEDGKGPANISLENNVKITSQTIDEFGNDFEKTKKGFVDFLLLDEDGFPVAVLEAKKEDKEPLEGKEQARRYASSQNARFIILSNGNLHYFWDLEKGNPEIITEFPTQSSLKHRHSFKPNPKSLTDEKVDYDFIALTQNANFKKDPRWGNKNEKEELIKEQELKILRPYQLAAIHALQNAARENKDRYLFEMATGTGKTLISAAVVKLFLKTGNAKRILFLVDRIELEDQAAKNFKKWLHNDYTCIIYKENKDDWKKAEVVISTVQSLAFNNKYQKLFSPTDFELVISDEAHRSISGNSRAIFEYFIGYKLGLTATPKDYLKHIDPKKISDQDPRAWERRQLLDTYKTFGCETGNPTFRYSLLDGVKDGFLVNPIVVDARTEITTQLLSDKGYSLVVKDGEGIEEEKTYFNKDFERKFFSVKTNVTFCEIFIKNALKDPISGEVGKSIIFCVSQKHSSKVVQILNQLADIYYPGKYNSDFAIQVTSNIQDSQQFSINFTNNNLLGRTKFLEGYKSSKARVCVTVGMMTTGYDCQDILNIGLMRPIFSPTDFIQIKGRGTRKFSFNYQDSNNEIHQEEKKTFKLFDFFANVEYFEEKYDYDQVIELPKGGTGTEEPNGGGTTVVINGVTISVPDPEKTKIETPIGLKGMKVDWMLFEKFEHTVKNNSFIKQRFDEGDIESVEDYIKTDIFNKPEDFFNMERLRKSVRADRRISLREIIEKIFGRINNFKTKDELLEEEFEKFISIYKPKDKDVSLIKNYLKAYITDNEIREIIDSKDYARLATNSKLSLAELKQLKQDGYMEIIPEYVKDYVLINLFL